MTPYRAPHLPAPKAEPPREIVYKPLVKDGRMSAVRSYVRYFIVVLPISVVLVIVHWALAATFVAIVIAWDVAQSRRERLAGIRLTIGRAKLAIHPPRGDARTIALRKLLNVSLDTRTSNRAGREVRPDGILASGTSFTVDESRIVFVVAGIEPLNLTDEYYSQSDTAEWLGKIRVLLRAHGWVPEDERETTHA